MSTFHGLEMAKQALFAQQSALYTTGNNIANANTKGYSRQRVNFDALPAYPAASRNRPQIPGQMGTGVRAGNVERVRNQYLDYQFRSENSKGDYWQTKADALGRMETLMNEPTDSGLSKTMNQFWQSLQDLATNPENTGARSVVAQRGQAVAETFNYLSDSLHSVRSDLKGQIDATVKDANSIVKQVNSLNKQIKNIETNGYLANDLYDERDRLIDQLSGIMNIKVSYTKSSDGSMAIADGLATVEIVDNEGKPLGITLVDGENPDELTYQTLKMNYADGSAKAAKSISFVKHDKDGAVIDGQHDNVDVNGFPSNGSLRGFVESYGYMNNDGNVVGDYPDMLNKLNKMANAFATQFNEVHSRGKTVDGEKADDFFENFDLEDAAGSITVKQEILDDPGKIAASKGESAGDGSNALDLAGVFDQTNDELDGSSVNDYYRSLIGSLGVDAQEANRMAHNTDILQSQVDNQRQSVSSVSLDEEMANMIKFQHAYSAAARSMTTVDEMINRVINNMGLVGR